MKKYNFTLIELLVVVAIIGILASLILPSLGKVRAKARATQCINNNKQMGMGITAQVDDNKDYYVSQYNGDNYGSVAYDAAAYYNSTALNTTAFGNFQVPLAQSYQMEKASFLCPDSYLESSKANQFRDDYGFNQHLHSTNNDKSVRISSSSLAKPVETMLVTDQKDKWLKYGQSTRINVRHQGSKLIHLWGDGHVTALSYHLFANNRQWITLESGQAVWTGPFTIK